MYLLKYKNIILEIINIKYTLKEIKSTILKVTIINFHGKIMNVKLLIEKLY